MQTLGVLYINGLSGGSMRLRERLARKWWHHAGVAFYYAGVDWYGGKSFDEDLTEMVEVASRLVEKYGRLVVIGSSAGGSLALSTFFELRDKNICAVSAHGRLREGGYVGRNSLYHRAHLDTNKPSQSFYDSVRHVENEVLPNMSEREGRRILILSQLTDLVVPTELMTVEGVKEHRSFAFGHSGGFFAHLLADRDLIIKFTDKELE